MLVHSASSMWHGGWRVTHALRCAMLPCMHGGELYIARILWSAAAFSRVARRNLAPHAVCRSSGQLWKLHRAGLLPVSSKSLQGNSRGLDLHQVIDRRFVTYWLAAAVTSLDDSCHPTCCRADFPTPQLPTPPPHLHSYSGSVSSCSVANAAVSPPPSPPRSPPPPAPTVPPGTDMPWPYCALRCPTALCGFEPWPSGALRFTWSGKLHILPGSSFHRTRPPVSYTFMGCYADNATRAIPVLLGNGTNMTVAGCAAMAQRAGFLLFGVQAGTQVSRVLHVHPPRCMSS